MRLRYESPCRRARVLVKIYDEQDAEIQDVWTDPEARGQGIMRQVMTEVLADADREGLSLLLNVGLGRHRGGMTHEELWDWYERLGFHRIIDNRMERLARVTTEMTSAEQ